MSDTIDHGENYRIEHYYSLEAEELEEGKIFCTPAEAEVIRATLATALPDVTVTMEGGAMIAAPQRALHRWKVEYRRVNQPTSRVFQLVVRATDTDDARRQAKLLDPHYGSTTKSPRRLRETT